ncbi:enoyl-CoA hydratase/isomerase family protein [Agarilytica rhodophyticola]|uniref:enoyl-CoA hydratase/isomerase family protein n=1 Tax=Agarilytica rhodophyticola TaxID=1737490 RepID=UPI000B34237F|nr:enoyl-CoA hydratase/isomerase family protein [Agarilytica rhodophyticola]
MSDNILCETFDCPGNKKLARITLNSPKTLNALSLDMAKAMSSQLSAWENDDSIACVLIQGSGDKAFCAGGDVRAMYYAMKENPGQACNAAELFFATEYRLDYTIHTYKKPVIALGNGIIMGGGLGIFVGADFRVVTPTSRVAMPEITIGLYPDVGASYFLNKMPGYSGRFLGLTGAAINASDCIDLDLADIFIDSTYFEEIFAQLCQQTWQNNKELDSKTIDNLLQSFAQDSLSLKPASNVLPHLDSINAICSEADIHTLIDNFAEYQTEDKWLSRAQKTLAAGSPLSALIIDQQLQIAKAFSLKEAFKSEMILSTNIVRFTEFTEGVRALLVDKDNAPNWHYRNHRDIPQEVVDGFFKAPWAVNPLDNI